MKDTGCRIRSGSVDLFGARRVSRRGLRAEAGVRARGFEEVVPRLIAQAVFVETEQRPPAWGDWLAQRVHVCLVGELVRLPGIAADA